MTPRERAERIEKEIAGVAAQYGVDAFEKGFLWSIRGKESLTEAQERVLARIETKVFGESIDD